MKRLSIVLLTIGIISAGLFSSCNKDDETTPPTIIITEQAGATYQPGTSVDFIVNISSNEDLTSFWVEESIDSDPIGEVVAMDPADVYDYDNDEFESGVHSIQITYRYYVPASGVVAGSTVKVTFEVDDKETIGTTNSIEFDVVANAATYERFTAVLMGAQDNATVGSYLDASTGDVMLKAAATAAQSLIDIVYYHGTTNQATLCAPSDVTVGGGAANFDLCEGWATKNATVFGTSAVTATEFAAISDDSFAENISALSATKMVSLVEGNIFAFETVDGNKGLVKVGAITTGGAGQVEIEVVIEK